jgi:peptide/nickel transport system permease protein/oligopeptide transport system permease protein
MGRYVARRLLQLVPVFVGTTFLIFAMVFAMPGDPVQRLAGERRPDPARAAFLRAEYNLDDPLVVQYAKYMGGLVQGDFGKNFAGREVSELFRESWPVTLRLALTAFAIEIVFGLLAGVLAGIKRGGLVDRAVLISTLIVVSIPVFVLGFTLQLLVGVKAQDVFHLPVAGVAQGWPTSYLLPAFVLAMLSLAYVARLTRTSLVENLRADYVRTAVAKGLPRWRVVGLHTLRNSLIPVVTYLGTDLGALMGGAVVTEFIFNIPGVGFQIAFSVRAGEATVVVGMVTLLVLIYLLANLVVDVLYGVLDPRIRYE